MANSFEDDQRSIYQGCSRNEVKLKQLAYCDSLLDRKVFCAPNENSAYQPQVYNYKPHDDYQSIHENEHLNYQTENHGSKNTIRFKRRPNASSSADHPLNSSSEFLASTPVQYGVPYSSRARNISTPMCRPEEHNYYDCPSGIFPALPTRVWHKAYPNQGLRMMANWDGFSRPPSVLSSSPLDSGVSSRSFISIPSLEAEPIISRDIRHSRIPHPHEVAQARCTCSTNTDSPSPKNLYDRSSFFVHSNGVSPNSTYGELPAMSSRNDQDQRRYMSGACPSPREYDPRKGTTPSKSKRSATPCPSNRIDESCSYGQTYTDDNIEYTLQPSAGQIPARHLKNGVRVPEDSNEADTTIPSEEETESLACLSDGKSQSKANASSRVKRSNNSEKEICELVELYNQLNLQDSFLLDRAERRDLPTAHQLSRNNPFNVTLTKNYKFFEVLSSCDYKAFLKSQRATLRRSGVPDVLADDMAIRKWHKHASKLQPRYEPLPSYMLCSPHFTPSIRIPSRALEVRRPDIENDDYSFRRYPRSCSRQGYLQPPFGIPLRPNNPQSVYSDYMHVMPSCMPPPLCHPRGNPDLVRDDLAFRSLRKDDPQRAMYDSYSLLSRKAQ